MVEMFRFPNQVLFPDQCILSRQEVEDYTYISKSCYERYKTEIILTVENVLWFTDKENRQAEFLSDIAHDLTFSIAHNEISRSLNNVFSCLL